ncbi:hypothetical protein PS6_011811, partial [Mucor atramentarius]
YKFHIINGTIATIFEVDEDNIGLKKYANNGDEESDEEQLYWIQRVSRQVPGTSYARLQFPIVPAFATTIHKAESATIDCKSDRFVFFGAAAPLPLEALRKYGVDVEAINISRRIMGDNDQDDEEADDE